MHSGHSPRGGPGIAVPAAVELGPPAGTLGQSHLVHPAGRAISERPSPPTTGTGLVPRQVLVVEDDDKLALLIQRMLLHTGFAPYLASTGDAALRAMRSQPPSAAVIDVMIPHPDGIEVCRQFRRDGWTGPIVAISARHAPQDRERIVAAGANAFLGKPFRLAELISTIRGFDDRHLPE